MPDAGVCNPLSPSPWCATEITSINATLAGANHTAWAPKSTTLTGELLTVVTETEHQFWVLRQDGTTVATEDATKSFAGPVPTLAVDNGAAAELAGAFENQANVRFFSLSGGFVVTSVFAAGANAVGPAVILDKAVARRLLAVPQTNGAVALIQRADNSVARNTLTGNAGQSYAARFCGPALPGFFVVDAPGQLTVASAPYTTGPLSVSTDAQSVATGAPQQPPVVLQSATAADVFIFRDTGGVTSMFRYSVTPGSGPTSRPALANTSQKAVFGAAISGTAAIGFDGVLPRIAVPLDDGTLAVVRVGAAELITDVWNPAQTQSTEALGGVVAIKADASEAADTFIFGDAAGRLHALRRSAELGTFGWPRLIAPGGSARPISQAPLVIPWLAEGLGLVVVSDVAANIGVTMMSLVSPGPVLTWPEYQHDSENSGCVVVP